MAEAAKGFETNLFASLRDNASFWGFALQQLQAGLKVQAELLDNLHSTTANCLRHRRQNIEDATTALGRMHECKDLGEVATIQQKWLSDCLHSLMEDFAALSGTAAEAARSWASDYGPAATDVKITKIAS